MNFTGTCYSYNITRDAFETNDNFYIRGWIIAKMQPQTVAELEEANTYARLWINHNNGCRYSDKVENLLIKWRDQFMIK